MASRSAGAPVVWKWSTRYHRVLIVQVDLHVRLGRLSPVLIPTRGNVVVAKSILSDPGAIANSESEFAMDQKEFVGVTATTIFEAARAARPILSIVVLCSEVGFNIAGALAEDAGLPDTTLRELELEIRELIRARLDASSALVRLESGASVLS
jgi:hypothetical protein